MRAYYQPNVPVPSIGDCQKYNREILRNRKVISMKSTKSLPIQVWNILERKGELDESGAGFAAVIIDAAGQGAPAWVRITTDAGDILDTAALPINGMSVFRHLAIKTGRGIFLCAIPEESSEPADVFLDAWQDYDTQDKKNDYDGSAVIFDKNTHTIYRVSENVFAGENKYIGYLYESKMRTLPVPKEDLSPSRVARVKLRFLESRLTFIRGYSPEHKDTQPDRIISMHGAEYIDGIADVPVPSTVERDASFEILTNEPEPLSLIRMFSEEE